VTWLIDRARGRVALAATVLLTAWIVVRYSGTSAFGLPFLVAWVLLVAALVIGRLAGLTLLAAGGWRGLGRSFVIGLAIAALAGLVAWLAFGAPRSVAARFALLVAISTWVGIAVAARRREGSWLVALMAAETLATWPLVDSYLTVRPLTLYDFHVYIGAGQRLLAGGQPYLTQPLTQLPPGPFQDAFPYPPVLLPLFALAAQLPAAVAASGWVLLILAAAAVGLRLFGLGWRWVIVFLAFPPLVKGIDSGNVAYLAFPLFAAAPYAGGALVISTLLKVQFAVPVLWLIRERRWQALLAGVGITLGLILITFPLVGVDRWEDWVRALGYRATSQVNLPILYGLSLARYLPAAGFVLLSAVAVLLPLRLRGWRALAALGLATIVVSPTLWEHGFLLALPAVLALDPVLLWPVLGIGIGGAGLWVLVVLGALALFTGSRDQVLPEEPMHPLGGTTGPWAAAQAWAASPGWKMRFTRSGVPPSRRLPSRSSTS
jgi:Glycosyltransferase family 87